MIPWNRWTERGTSGRIIVAGLLAFSGGTGSAHAAEAVVEGISSTPEGAQFANIRYRCEGQSCLFEAVLEGVSSGDVTEYEWRFDDGHTVSTATPVLTHDWAEPGPQSLELMVHDQYCDPLVAEAFFTTLAPVSGSVADQPRSEERLTPTSVRLGQDATRIVSEPLGGTTIGGEIFVFVEALEGAERVVFRLIGSDGVRDLRVEWLAPFDLAGGSTSSANPFDTRRFADGAYRLEVAAKYADGSSETVSPDFHIRNEAPVQVAEGPSGETPQDTSMDDANEPSTGAANPDGSDVTAVPDTSGDGTGALLFSSRADRTGGKSLDGASVDGRIYPYLDGAEGADSVRFFLDDPTFEGDPLQVEYRAPWDAMGGSFELARPLDTGRLSVGQHVLSAKVAAAGETFAMHASFVVAAPAN